MPPRDHTDGQKHTDAAKMSKQLENMNVKKTSCLVASDHPEWLEQRQATWCAQRAARKAAREVQVEVRDTI